VVAILVALAASLGCTNGGPAATPVTDLRSASARLPTGGSVVPAGPAVPWDRLVVVAPYASRRDLAEHEGISPESLPSSGVWDDDDSTCLILYVAGRSVVAYEEIDRSLADFCPGDGSSTTRGTAFVKEPSPFPGETPRMRPLPS